MHRKAERCVTALEGSGLSECSRLDGGWCEMRLEQWQAHLVCEAPAFPP